MMIDTFLPALVDEASSRFRTAGHFAYHYARGKLSGDCIFREILARGLFPAEAHFLDLGCGQGSLFAWLLAARRLYERDVWPATWPTPPRPLHLLGYELMSRDVERAARAFGECEPLVDIRQGDMCQANFGTPDVVTILDALHYVDFDRQEDLLRKIREALPPQGLFLTRIGDAGAGFPYHLCTWVDHAVTFARGHRLSRLYGRKLADWLSLLQGLGFSVEAQPMSAGKPFANVMLVCRVAA